MKTPSQNGAPEYADEIVYILRKHIHPDPDQPRVKADDELRASIEAQGIIQAITVRPHPVRPEHWMIVDGERRWLGSEKLDEVPCRIRYDLESDADRLITQITANTGRPLSPIEQARAFKKILDADPGLTQITLAKRLGIARSTVGDRIRLAETPAPWMALIEPGELQVSHAPFIHPFAQLDVKVHRAAVATFKRQSQHYVGGVPVEAFKRILQDAYEPQLYPLQKSKQSWLPQPEFGVASHDKECKCGRIRAAIRGSDARDFCGNPDWWKPRKEEHDRREAEKQLARQERQGGASGARSGPTITLPEGAARPIKVAGWGEKPDGVIRLTGNDGRWDMSAGPFDPADLGEFEPAELVPVVEKHGNPWVGTTAKKKVADARKKFRERMAVAVAEYCTEAKEKSAPLIARVGLRGDAHAIQQILLAVVHWDTSTKVIAAAASAGIEVPEKFLERAGAPQPDAVRKWIEEIPASAAAEVLAAFALLTGDAEEGAPAALFNVLDAIEEHRNGLIAQAAAKPVPWVKPPTSKDGRPLVECAWCEEFVPEDELRESDTSGTRGDKICAECEQQNADDEYDDEEEEAPDVHAEEELEEELVGA